MSTNTRPELSSKNKYYVEKHRYYELKHFCLQYPVWKKAYLSLDSLSRRPHDIELFKSNKKGSPIERCVEARLYYSERMKIIEDVTKETDEYLHTFILRAVTEELSFEYLKTKLEIPCSRGTYYELYRKFFWLLNVARK